MQSASGFFNSVLVFARRHRLGAAYKCDAKAQGKVCGSDTELRIRLMAAAKDSKPEAKARIPR